MLSFVFDTETSGFSKRDHTDPENGKLVQFYGALYEHDPNVSYIDTSNMTLKLRPIATLHTIVDSQVEVPQGAYEVHGIDKAKQAKYGADAFNVACLLEDFLDIADRLVAHNINFDVPIIKHFLWSHDREVDYIDGKEQYCTMRTLKPLMRLTPKKFNDWRFPKLIEGYRYIFDRDFKGDAHDASADAQAAADIYFGLLHMNVGIANQQGA